MRSLATSQQTPILRFDQVAGAPLTQHGLQITPIARTLRFEWLGARIRWERPLAVEVRDGTATYRLPIPDLTGRTLVAITLAGGAFAVLLTVWSRSRTA